MVAEDNGKPSFVYFSGNEIVGKVELAIWNCYDGTRFQIGDAVTLKLIS
jgi:hypothetical protein